MARSQKGRYQKQIKRLYDEGGNKLLDFRKKQSEKTKRYFRRLKAADPEAYKRMKNMRYQKKSTQQRLLEGARLRAKQEGIPFDITVKDIIVPSHCPILGIEIRRGKGKIWSGSPSLDKVDPSKGYVKNNIQVISYEANKLKSYMTPELMMKLYNYTIDNWPKE